MDSSFNLDPAVPMSEAVRRVACAELDAASAGLTSPPDRHKGVHDARKCLKKLRSLLLLIRPGLPEALFLSLTERVRTIARGLASARDAHALLDAINKLEAQVDDDGAPIVALRDWLRQRRQAAERNLEGDMSTDALRALFALRPAMANLAVYPDDFRPVAKGLRESYRDGRKAFARAFASGADEDFHDWRKTLQHHWRHMQLLTPCWPSELTARAELSRSLSQILGDDHDIALIQQLVSAPTMTFASPEDTAAFLKRCRRRQRALRQDARKRGGRLLAERSRPFVDRIEALWLDAAQAAKTPPAVAQPSNVVAFGDAGGRARASG
ncbi:MAG: CHAD domain-containing protein [Methyloceanibacter sp.]